jgi:hypothetical protein
MEKAFMETENVYVILPSPQIFIGQVNRSGEGEKLNPAHAWMIWCYVRQGADSSQFN